MDTLFNFLEHAQGLTLALIFSGILSCIVYLGLHAQDDRLVSLTDSEPGTFTADEVL